MDCKKNLSLEVTAAVIIPCYNVSPYIERCINSLLTNDFDSKRLIFINDGSTDNTGDLLDKFAQRHNCIIVIHQKNGGVASARNAGLQIANSKYILFCDPDDYVCPNFISTAVNEIEKSNRDMLLFGFNSDWTGRIEPALPIEDYDLKTPEEIRNILFPRIFGLSLTQFNRWTHGKPLMSEKETGQIWRWIYRKRLLDDNNIKFRDVKVGEDMVFNCECLLAANNVGSINDCLYNYFPRKDGLMYSNIHGLDSYRNKLDMLRERKRIGTIYQTITGNDALELYGGSCVMSCFELAFLLSKAGRYDLFRSYVADPTVQKSISKSKLGIQNKKALIPHALLKAGAYRLLYIMFLVINKLKLRINY